MSVFDDAAKILGADVVEELRAHARALAPLTEAERAHLAPLLARYLPKSSDRPAASSSRAA